MCNSVKNVNKILRSFFLLLMATGLVACGGGGSSEGTGGSGPTINKPTPSSIAASSLAEQPSSTPESSSSQSSSSSSLIGVNGSHSSELAYTRSSRNSSSQPDKRSSTIPLSLYRLSETGITVTWDDTNTGAIAHYLVKRDNNSATLVEYPALMFADQGLQPSSTYTYSITAIDEKGNNLGESDVLVVQTLGLAYSSAPSSLAASSAATVSSGASSSLATSSTAQSVSSVKSSASTSSKSTSNSSSSAAATQTATITWSHPNQRENGSFLELDEIAGYEIRYRKPTDTRYTYIVINSNRVTEYTTAKPALGTEFEIAVFDINGLYSRFSKITQ